MSALTAKIKSNFWQAWHQVAAPAPWQKFTTEIDSTTKIENYLNATPVPGFARWTGTRNFAQIDSFIYPVRNETWHSEITAKLEDIEDDQVGLMEKQPGFLAEKGKEFPGRMACKLVGQALGSPIALRTGVIGNLNAFDGLPYYGTRLVSTAGAFGNGINLIQFTSGSGDGLKYNIAAMFVGVEALKPVAWQRRSGPDLETDGGSPASKLSRSVKWWCDLRGAPFFTYFWNSVAVQITNTPSPAEMHAIFNAVLAAFRTFQYPQSIVAEDGEYPHEQTDFTAGNLHYLASTALAEQFNQALHESWIPQNIGGNTVATTNIWKDKAAYTVSRFLDMQ